MDRVVRFRVLDAAARDRVTERWRTAASQPNWIIKAAAIVFLAVVVLPLLLLVGIVALAMTLVFGGLALLKGAVGKVRRLVRGDGRSNVRVIRRTGGYRVDE
ncbi:MAG: hypothetical protein ACYTE6_12290 [Planctomycetota bacterium]|jgi:uncharacterized membrane protein